MWKAGLVLMATLAAGLAGEPAPAKAAGEAEAFVPIIEQEFKQGARDPDLPERVERPARRDAARIAIQCQFIALRARDLADRGIRSDRPAIVISAEQLGTLTEFARSVRRLPPLVSLRHRPSQVPLRFVAQDARQGGVLLSKHSAVSAGERLSVQVLANQNFIVAGVIPPTRPRGGPDDEPPQDEPIIGNVAEGLILEAEAVAVERHTEFTLLDARVMILLDIPDCIAVARVDGREVRLAGQEPCVLVRKSSVPTPCDVTVKAGGSALIPLRDRSLVVRRSNVRALVKAGKARISRDETAKFLSQFDRRGYPLEVDTTVLVVVTPTVVKLPPTEF